MCTSGGRQLQGGLKRAGALDPLQPAPLPEILDYSQWLGGFASGFTDVDGQYVYAHRAEIARTVYGEPRLRARQRAEPHRGPHRPRWRAALRQDPREEGHGPVDAGHMLMLEGEDWLRALMAQESVVTRDQRQQVDWLVRGRYPIAISPARQALQAYQADGLGQNVRPLAPDSPLGSRISFAMGVALFNRAPHPNAVGSRSGAVAGRPGGLGTQPGQPEQSPVGRAGPARSPPVLNTAYAAPLNKEANVVYLDRAKEIAAEVIC